MATSAHRRPIAPIASNTQKAWRGINAAMMLLPLFAPWWSPQEGTILNGFQTIQFMAGFTVSIIRYSPKIPWLYLYHVMILLGSIILIMYFAMNMLTVFSLVHLVGTTTWSKLVVGLVTFGAVTLSFLALSDVQYGLKNVLWGYWLTYIGFASSVLIEIRVYLSKRP